MALVLILLMIALPSTTDWGRGAAMRTSAVNLRSSLAVTRRWAVSHGSRTGLKCGNDISANRAYCVVMDDTAGRIGQTNYLAKGIGFDATNSVCMNFDTNDVGWVWFRTDGSCDWTSHTNDTGDIVLIEPERRTGGLRTTVTVYRTTGYAKVLE